MRDHQAIPHILFILIKQKRPGRCSSDSISRLRPHRRRGCRRLLGIHIRAVRGSYPGSTRLLPDSYPTTSVSSHPGNSRFGDCLTTAGCFATAVWYALAPCPKPRPYYPFPKRCASQVLLHSAFMRICVPASPLCPPWLRPSGPRQAIHSLSSP